MYYKDELKIYYLFALVDGSVSEEENLRFAELCNSKEFGEYKKEEIINDCVNLLNNKSKSTEENVISEIDAMFRWRFININDKQRIFWNIINLAYSDKKLSASEAKVVEYLKKKLDIPENINQEMIDIAKTMVLLTEQKETLEVDSEKNKEEIKNIDSKISVLFGQVKSLVELYDVV